MYVKSLGLAVAIGIPIALAAVLFMFVYHELEHFLWEVIPEHLGTESPPWWLVLALPTIGGLLVAAALRLPGHGGHAPYEGFGHGSTEPRTIISILLASLASLAFGAVLGPELPLLALGSALGLIAARWLSYRGVQEKITAGAGSFASMGAVFGNPLNTAFLMTEGGAGLGKKLVPAILPGLVAAGMGYLIFTGIGNWSGLSFHTMAVTGIPVYETVRLTHLFWAIIVAFFTAIFSISTGKIGRSLTMLVGPVPSPSILAVSGLAIGASALIFRALTGEGFDLVLFSGQAAIPTVLTITSIGTLLLLLIFKGAAFSVSLGTGFRGGQIFPAISFGVILGVLGSVVISDLPVTPAIAAGIAAGVTALARLPITGVLLAVLLLGAGGIEATPAAIIGSATAYLVASAYEKKIKNNNH